MTATTVRPPSVVDVLNTESLKWLEEITTAPSLYQAHEAAAMLIHRLAGWTKGLDDQPRDLGMREAQMVLSIIRGASARIAAVPR